MALFTGRSCIFIKKLFLKHRLGKPLLEHLCNEYVQRECGEEAHDGVYQVVRLYIYGSKAEQNIEWKKNGEQFLASAPGHDHQYSRYTDVGTGECGGGALAYLLGAFDEVIEESAIVFGR